MTRWGDLTSVVQEMQTPRTFAYDGLARKISESTPEAGTISDFACAIFPGTAREFCRRSLLGEA